MIRYKSFKFDVNSVYKSKKFNSSRWFFCNMNEIVNAVVRTNLIHFNSMRYNFDLWIRTELSQLNYSTQGYNSSYEWEGRPFRKSVTYLTLFWQKKISTADKRRIFCKSISDTLDNILFIKFFLHDQIR